MLALDLGRTTGWATNMHGRIESGIQKFELGRGESVGMLYHLFNQFLHKFKYKFKLIMDGNTGFILNKIDLIVYEQTHQRGGAATEQAAGYATRVQEFCVISEIECENVHTGTLKLFWTGHGNASKADMIAECKRRGFNPVDDNEADAIAILHWALDQYGGE